MTTTITLTLPSYTPKQAREALERYDRLLADHQDALDARNWKLANARLETMQDIADALVEDAVLRGAWRVGEEPTA